MNKNTKKYIILFILFILLLLFVLLTHLHRLENFNSDSESNNAFELPNNQLDQEQEPPYYVSILAIMKNEAMNLKTWIDHYIWQGVDHIYLIDNGSTDDSVNIVKELQNKGYPITLHELLKKHSQTEHYKKIYEEEKIPEKSKWLIIADLDEFFYCKNSTIKKELKSREDIPVIYSQWRNFGSDNLEKHPEDIRISITHRKQELSHVIKSIFQTKYVKTNQITIHEVTGFPQDSNHVFSDVFRLNHYQIQSKEYFEKVKMVRGDVNDKNYENKRDWNIFKEIDKDTNFEDTDLKDMILNA